MNRILKLILIVSILVQIYSQSIVGQHKIIEESDILCDSISDNYVDCDTLSNWRLSRNQMEFNNISFLFILDHHKKLISNLSTRVAKGASIVTWDLFDGKQKVLSYLGNNVWINFMTVSHNEDFVVVSTFGKEPTLLKCFSIAEKKWIWEIKDLDHYKCLSFSSDDKEIMAFGNDAVYRIDTYSGSILEEIDQIHEEYPLSSHKNTNVFFSQSGKYLVIWQEQGPEWSILDLFRKEANKNISVWDLKKKKIIASLPLPTNGVRSAVFTPNEDSIFLSFGDDAIGLWLEKENKIAKQVTGNAIHLVISNKQNILVAAIENEDKYFEARFWKYPDMTLIKNLKPFSRNFTNYGIMPINFSDDGKYCAIERTGILFLYDTFSWDVVWCSRTDI